MSKARASTKKSPRARRKITASKVGRRAGVAASVRSGSSELRVEVLGDEIIVILPATSYGITYYKPPNSAQLLVKNYLSKIDRGAPINSGKVPRSGVAGGQRESTRVGLDHRSRQMTTFEFRTD